MITTHEVKQGSSEWHALRAGLVTASNATVLLNRGKNAARSTQGASGGGFWANRGHILEDEAIEIYEQVYGVKVDRPGFITNDDYPECGFSPDGIDGEIPLEVKCFAEAKHLLCINDTPVEPYSQLQFGEMITETTMGRLIFYNPDVEDDNLCFVVVDAPRDELLIARFQERLR